MTAEQVAARLHARQSGSGWIGHCPGEMHAHGDRNPSLSISTGRSGRVVMHCFGGCSIESICAALKIKVSDLFPEPGVYQPKPRTVRDAEKRIAGLRSRLTPRERVLPVTVVSCDLENLDAGIVRALALSIAGEIVQVVSEGER